MSNDNKVRARTQEAALGVRVADLHIPKIEFRTFTVWCTRSGAPVHTRTRFGDALHMRLAYVYVARLWDAVADESAVALAFSKNCTVFGVVDSEITVQVVSGAGREWAHFGTRADATTYQGTVLSARH